MTVGYVGATESVRTGTTSPHTFSHTVGATARGLVLFAIHGTSSTDHAPPTAAVTVGGKAMGKVATAADTSTEPGRVDAWFLGHDLPSSGAQTVSAAYGATTDDIQFVMVELSGSRDLEVVDAKVQEQNAANPSVTLDTGTDARACIAVGGVYSGLSDPSSLTPNGSMTAIHDHDFGAFVARVDRQTSASASDFAYGYTAATDDLAMVAVAVSEERDSPLRDAVLSMSPAGYWRLGEPAGCLTAFDRGPNLRHGVYMNTPTLAVAGSLVGDVDAAATLTATSVEHVSVADDAAFDYGSGDWTLVVMSKQSSGGLTSKWLVSKKDQFNFLIDSGGKLTVDNFAGSADYRSDSAVNGDASWHHLAATNAGGTHRLYRDGTEVAGTPTGTLTGVSNSAPLYIGVESDDLFGPWDGSLDECAVFASALSAAQVAHLHAMTTGRVVPDPPSFQPWLAQ